MLDTDSKDLVTVHTDGNEQLSVMSYGPGVGSFDFRRPLSLIYLYAPVEISLQIQLVQSFDFLAPDGNFLAIGSHDSYIYIYAVAENGRKYSRVGKCSVGTCF